MHDLEEHIIERLKKGDQIAYKELFDFFYMPLCIYAVKFIDSYQDAEDIVQDFFVKFWNNKMYLNINMNLKSYLFTSIRNNALNFLRQKNKYIFEAVEDIEVKIEELDKSELSVLEERLQQEIEALPEKSREVFLEVVLNDLKYKEVAEKLGISINTVKTQLARALKKLRSSIDSIILLLLVKRDS